MSKTEQDYTQPVGLDVGTSRIVVARNAERRFQYAAELNAFLTLPYSKVAQSLLERENVFHEVHGPEILVAGNDAQKFAEVFHVETRRPMKDGVLSPEEPHSLAVVRSIVSRLLGTPGIEGQKVFFSVPRPRMRAMDVEPTTKPPSGKSFPNWVTTRPPSKRAWRWFSVNSAAPITQASVSRAAAGYATFASPCSPCRLSVSAPIRQAILLTRAQPWPPAISPLAPVSSRSSPSSSMG